MYVSRVLYSWVVTYTYKYWEPASTSSSSATTLQQTSRPRLVAKSAGGLRESTPKPANVASKNGSGGPDPNQVWNKNRRKSGIQRVLYGR